MLKVNEIHTYYGDSYILQGISFDVKPKQVVGLLGRNGMGNTTLIRSIVGLTPARRGQITYHDQDITHRRPFEIARLGISLVPQGRLIFPSRT
jgi:branched-chain amino acid transport system ATP-binding protein